MASKSAVSGKMVIPITATRGAAWRCQSGENPAESHKPTAQITDESCRSHKPTATDYWWILQNLINQQHQITDESCRNLINQLHRLLMNPAESHKPKHRLLMNPAESHKPTCTDYWWILQNLIKPYTQHRLLMNPAESHKPNSTDYWWILQNLINQQHRLLMNPAESHKPTAQDYWWILQIS